jgi:pyroglutamyl-peptidase
MAGRALLTGFEPFGGDARNPSLETARALDGKRIGAVEVVGRTLPVSLAAMPGALGQLLADVKPDFVLSLGLAGGATALRLERFGVNLADFDMADNDGAVARGRKLIADGPEAIAATLPLAEIEQALLAAGIPAAPSNTAGTYLCNALIYHLGIAARAGQGPARFGFIHVPYLPEQVAARLGRGTEPAPSMALDTMIRAAEIAIEVSGRPGTA